MKSSERAYLRALMRKRDEYLLARDQEHIVPERLPSLMGGGEPAFQVQLLIENLRNERRNDGQGR